MELITRKSIQEVELERLKQAVRPFNEKNLTPFGIDLTVGEHCQNLTKGDAIRLGKEEELEVRPGDFVIIYTEESLYVPDDWVGLVFPKVRLLTDKQLSQPGGGGKVNPGFEGPLKVAVQNISYTLVKLKRGEPICCVAFWRFL